MTKNCKIGGGLKHSLDNNCKNTSINSTITKANITATNQELIKTYNS